MNSLFDDDEVVIQLNKESAQHQTDTKSPPVLVNDEHGTTVSFTADDQTLKLFDVPPDKTLKRREASIISPLRYPGSKRRFACYVAEALHINKLRPKLFVEPFAGGASVALQMLGDDLVERIGLGELDPLVADFWHCVFYDAEWLIDSINSLEVTMDTWRYYKELNPTTTRERALTCLFLNRTSFSGILKNEVGPIGGISQSSRYGIDCRFTKPTIIRRIRQASRFKDRVEFIRNASWEDTLNHLQCLDYKPRDVFVYLDPPFYNKASDLYRHFFMNGDHGHLRDGLRGRKFRWLLSCDAADEIKKLYSDKRSFAQQSVELLYTIARSKTHYAVKEIVVTNLPELPLHDRVWRTTAQW